MVAVSDGKIKPISTRLYLTMEVLKLQREEVEVLPNCKSNMNSFIYEEYLFTINGILSRQQIITRYLQILRKEWYK